MIDLTPMPVERPHHRPKLPLEDCSSRLLEEVRRLRTELERERAGGRLLREALELAATYFDAPADDPAGEAAWQLIVAAIRSEAGRG